MMQQSDTSGAQQLAQSLQKMSLKPQTEDQKDKEEGEQALKESDRNLIINYIPPSMNEGALASLFSPYGAFENIKIVIDLQTGRSRGYGFVKYATKESAEKALKALNGLETGGKRLKVAYARPQCKEIQNSNLYVTNIPLHWTENKLRSLFDDFGTIVESRILKDDEGKSRGVGFVRMDTHLHAIKALESLDRYKPDGNEPALVVKLAQRRNQNRRNWMNAGQQNKMAPRGTRRTGMNVSDNKLSHDGQQGQPSPYYIKRGGGSPNRGRAIYRPRSQYPSNGRQYRQRGLYMYGDYPYYQPASGVSTGPSGGPNQGTNAGQNDQTSGGANTQAVNPSQGGSRNYSNTTFNIIVYNLPPHYNVDHLIQLYAPYGPIQSVNIQKPQDNTRRGQIYGVISYFYFDDAQRAQSETNGRKVGDRRLEVVFQAK